jgi:hypothetical protein
VLNKKLIWGFQWVLFALVLTWGSGRAAYLPVIGPAPMRFASPPRPAGMGRLIVKTNSNDNLAASPARRSNTDWIAETVLPDFLLAAWPFQNDDENRGSFPSADPDSRMTALRMVFPEELVPFFGPGPGGPTNRTGEVMLFAPPNRSQPSSTAIYTKH